MIIAPIVFVALVRSDKGVSEKWLLLQEYHDAAERAGSASHSTEADTTEEKVRVRPLGK